MGGYRPSTNRHQEDFLDVLNEAYLAVMGERRWRWLQGVSVQPLYCERTGTATFTNGSRAVTAVVVTPTSSPTGVLFNGPIVNDAVAGQLLVGGVYSTSPLGLGASLITRASNAGLWTLDVHNGATGTRAITLRFSHFALPNRAGEVLGIRLRQRDQEFPGPLDLNAGDKGSIPLMLAADDADFPDRTGQPEVALLAPRALMWPSATALDWDVWGTVPPRATFVCTPTNTGANALVANTTYRYFYTYNYAGAISGRSPVVETATTGANRTIAITALEAETSADMGRTKSLWRDQDKDGCFKLVTNTAIEPSISIYNDDGAIIPNHYSSWDEGQSSARRVLRLWPRPDVDYFAEVRYMERPVRFGLRDEPVMPPNHHILLVYRAAQVLLTRWKQFQAVPLMKSLADEAYTRMKTSDIGPDAGTPLVKGSWDPRGPPGMVQPALIRWNP